MATVKEQVEVKVISPKEAARLLREANHSNRKLRQSVVEKYARDMAEGRWTFSGDSIRFNGGDLLVDGQHRLAAVVSSGVPLKTVVVKGISEEAKFNIDMGAKRSFADILHYLGYRDKNQLAAVIRFCWMYENGNILSGKYPTHNELLAWLRKNEGIVDSQKMMSSIHLPYGCMKTVCSAIHYYTSKHMPGEASSFFMSIKSMQELTDGSPALALIKWLQWNDTGVRKSPPVIVQGTVIKAWNAHIEGRSLKMIRFSPRGTKAEPFPEIVTKYPGPDHE